MTVGQIEIQNLHKRFGQVQALNNLSFSVEPGKVTGFLGPNGSGKTTTLRILLNLVRQNSGTATISGKPYQKLSRAIHQVGAALDTTSFHSGFTGRNHLKVTASASKIGKQRIDELLELVGLTHAADRKIGGYSLGMKQRLGLANALLGDPQVLILDEPINGLDPDGIRWMRNFLKNLAAEGRTVLFSSHLLSEVEQSVDELIVINKGQNVYQGTVGGLSQSNETLVEAEDTIAFAAALALEGIRYTEEGTHLIVHSDDTAAIGRIALKSQTVLTHLSLNRQGLEERFLKLIADTDGSEESGGGSR